MRSAVYSRAVAQAPRPRGVWILTVCAAIFAGLLPLFGSLAVVFVFPEVGGSVPLMLATAALSLAVFGAAVGAWQGSDNARLALLVFVVLFYTLLAITNFYTATSDVVLPDTRWQATKAGWRSIAWIPLYLWYFLRADTVAWYRER